MDTNVLNYRIVITPDKRTGTNKPCFTAHCPTLGVVDDGDTIEEAIVNIRDAIQAYLESLAEDNQPIPIDNPTQLITTTQVTIHRPFSFA